MRETKYKDLTQTKERKKFIWLTTLLLVLTMICIILTTFVYAATQQAMGSHVHMHFKPADYLEYTTNSDNTLTVKGFKTDLAAQPAKLVIPANYKGGTVTSIAQSAFAYNKTITSVTIPETITSIGVSAFKGCVNINEIIYNAIACDKFDYYEFTRDFVFMQVGQNSADGVKVIFGENVTGIPDYMFYTHNLDAGFSNSYHPEITSVFISENVKNIGTCAFFSCSVLTEVTIESQTICSNLATWESARQTETGLVSHAKTVKAKYEITDYSSLGLTSQGLQADGYYLYTK